MTEGKELHVEALARDIHREVCGCAATPDWCDSSWLVAAEKAYDAICKQERQRLVDEAPEDLKKFERWAVERHAQRMTSVAVMAKRERDEAAQSERQREREALDEAILDCGEAAHMGSRAHDGSVHAHEAEREALERFRDRLDTLETPMPETRSPRCDQGKESARQRHTRVHRELAESRRLERDVAVVPEAALAKAREERDREKALREDAYRYQQAAEDLLNPEQKRVAALEVKLAKARKEGREEVREALKPIIEQLENEGADDCSFWACDGPQATEIVPMKTCARCGGVIELRAALDSLTKEGD